MTDKEAKSLLEQAGALIEGHFVGTNGNHLSLYVAKDRATIHTVIVSRLCYGIAERFYDDRIEAVVAPAVGGIPLSQWTAHHLTQASSSCVDVLALYAEPDGDNWVLKRGFNEDVKGKRVLVVEDTLTTGGSARRTVEAVEKCGGIVVGLGVLANGGNVTPQECGVSRLEALVSIEREIYTEHYCAAHGLCARQVPINTRFGHGAAFLARQSQT
jgi:orotate phosphoribosyltransferase